MRTREGRNAYQLDLNPNLCPTRPTCICTVHPTHPVAHSLASASPATATNVEQSCEHQCNYVDYCTCACERARVFRPHNNRLLVSACVPMHLPTSVLRAPACSSNDQALRIAVLRLRPSLSPNPGFGDQAPLALDRRFGQQCCRARARQTSNSIFHIHVTKLLSNRLPTQTQPPTCARRRPVEKGSSSSFLACMQETTALPATGGALALSCHITCRQTASWRATTGVRARDFPAASERASCRRTLRLV